jgi:hypothetical protein
MYLTNPMTSQEQRISFSNNGNDNCAVAIIGSGSSTATLLEVASLQGGMTLIGGVDYYSADHNEIAVFKT